MTRSYDDIKKSVEAKGYVWFSGEHDPNFIVERTKNRYDNAFTDFIHLCYIDNGNKVVKRFRCTSRPGLYGNGAVLDKNHSSADGVTGVASVKPGQYRRCWQMKNLAKLASGLACMSGNPHQAPSLHQIGNITVYRDKDRDLELERDNPTTTGSGYGLNGHYMGHDNDETPNNDNVNNWSIGCVGSPASVWYRVMVILEECSKYTGDKLTLTLLETSDFK